MYYNKCPLCGANLDPGEPCDCQEEKKSKKKLQLKNQREHGIEHCSFVRKQGIRYE